MSILICFALKEEACRFSAVRRGIFVAIQLSLTRPSDTLSPSDGERDGVRILRTPFRALNPCNLKMRKSLIIKLAILRFMGRGA